MTSASDDTSGSSSRLRTWAIVFGLWGLAVTQPLLDLLGRTTAFFLTHRADRLDLALFALAAALVGPVVLALPALFVGRSTRSQSRVQAVLGGLLATVVAALWTSRWPVAPWPAAAATLVGGGLAGAALWRWKAARTMAAWLGVAACVFPLLFYFVSPARKIGAGADSPNAARPKAGTLAPAAAVVVVLDEFPLVSLLDESEAIDEGRFPNFAALARASTWYRNATTAAQSTPFAIPTLLTGRYPRAGRGIQPVWVDYKTNLFTVVGRRANLHVVETMTRLCPERLCSGRAFFVPRRLRLRGMIADAAAVYLHLVTPRGWSHRLPVISDTWRDFWAPPLDPKISGRDDPHAQDSARVFDRFLDDLDAFPPPALHYVHLMTPHLPWTRLPDGTIYRQRQRAPHGLRAQSWRGSEWETVQAHQRHLLHVGWVDSLVGRLRARLEDRGLWRDATVVITSDHGAAFGTGGLRRNLRPANFSEIVNIPLFIKFPAQEKGVIDDSNVETVDVMPTVLAAMGAPVPPRLRGHDLAGPERREMKTVYHSGLRSVGPGRAEVYGLERLRERRMALDRQIERFGTGSWEAVYAAGPLRGIARPTSDTGRPPSDTAGPASGTARQTSDLLGTSLDDVPGAGGPPQAPTARLDYARDLENVDLQAAVLPVHLMGSLDHDPEQEPLILAVAVNGVVRATTETFVEERVEEGTVRFTAMVPRAALVEGKNTVELLHVETENEQHRLRRLRRGPGVEDSP